MSTEVTIDQTVEEITVSVDETTQNITVDVSLPLGVGSGTVTSVAIGGNDGIEVDSGSPVTSSGTIQLGLSSSLLASLVLANSSVQIITSTKIANYTAVANDVVLCDASGGSFTITLTSASSCTNKRIIVKKIDSSGYGVVVDGDGSETIDGSLTQTLTTQYDALVLISNGTSWYIV